jgi:glycosyltransferase involved in cell wall biosynthesis
MDHMIKRYSTHLFCAAASAGEALYGKHCWKDGRTAIVRNAIDIHAFETSVTRNDARMLLGLPVGAFIIGHVGRFHPVKNHAFLIDVLSGLRAMGVDARLVLSGDGPLKDLLLARIADRQMTDFVHLLGVRSDVPVVLASLDAFVFPSLYEGLGLSVIEAQAAGCPVIASDSIPLEADLDIGLLRRLPLNGGLHAWCEAILNSASKARVSWTRRLKALRQSGYDVVALAGSLEKVYSEGSRYANGAATHFSLQEK